MRVGIANKPTLEMPVRDGSGMLGAASLSLAGALGKAAGAALAQHFRLHDERDPLLIHEEPYQVRLTYQRSPDADPLDTTTGVRCSVEATHERMWVGNLQVAHWLRGRGHGRDLVRACEVAARAIGLTAVAVFPLVQAAEFWRSLGYEPIRGASRVLQKSLGADSQE